MDLRATGQNDATFLYPAATDGELADTDQLVTNYRRSMGRNRVYVALLGLVAFGWLTEYVMRGPRKKA